MMFLNSKHPAGKSIGCGSLS